MTINLPPVPAVKDFTYKTTRDHGSAGIHPAEAVWEHGYIQALKTWERVASLLLEAARNAPR